MQVRGEGFCIARTWNRTHAQAGMYGWSHPLNVTEILLRNDAREYERVMNRVFLCSYRRLENFISSKCDLGQYDCKLIPIKNEADMRSLMEIMRISRKEMGANDLHCFFKLLKAVYEDYPVSLSKKETCSLYKSMHNWVEFRKRKE